MVTTISTFLGDRTSLGSVINVRRKSPPDLGPRALEPLLSRRLPIERLLVLSHDLTSNLSPEGDLAWVTGCDESLLNGANGVWFHSVEKARRIVAGR